MRTRFINWIDRVWSAMREEHVCTCDCDPDGAYDDGYYNGQEDGYAEASKEAETYGPDNLTWDEAMAKRGLRT